MKEIFNVSTIASILSLFSSLAVLVYSRIIEQNKQREEDDDHLSDDSSSNNLTSQVSAEKSFSDKLPSESRLVPYYRGRLIDTASLGKDPLSNVSLDDRSKAHEAFLKAIETVNANSNYNIESELSKTIEYATRKKENDDMVLKTISESQKLSQSLSGKKQSSKHKRPARANRIKS